MLIFTSSGMSLVEKTLIAAMGRLFGVRVALAPRSGLLIDSLDSGSLWRRRLWRALLRTPNMIVCQSNYWALFFAERLGRDSSELPVIRNGINTGATVNSKLRKSTEPCRLLYLGWLESYKGPELLARAFLKLWREHPLLHLCICGSGSLDHELRRLLLEPTSEGRVRFAGWVDGEEKASLLANSHCLVLPSLREGSPNALLEAISSGMPVIGTAVGAVPEILQDGELGLLIDPNNIDALIEAIENIVREPEAAIEKARRARDFVAANHNMETIAEQWVGLFRNCDQGNPT